MTNNTQLCNYVQATALRRMLTMACALILALVVGIVPTHAQAYSFTEDPLKPCSHPNLKYSRVCTEEAMRLGRIQTNPQGTNCKDSPVHCIAVPMPPIHARKFQSGVHGIQTFSFQLGAYGLDFQSGYGGFSQLGR